MGLGPRAGQKNSILMPRNINDGDLINFDGKNYDLIIHAMGLHRANDPVGQLIQMNRALIPDGLVISGFFWWSNTFRIKNFLLHMLKLKY